MNDTPENKNTAAGTNGEAPEIKADLPLFSETDNRIQPEDHATEEIFSEESEQDSLPEETAEVIAQEEVLTEEIQEEIQEEEGAEEDPISGKIEAGEFTAARKEEEKEEIQKPHARYPKPIPVIDHRLLAGKLTVYNWLKDLPATDCVPEVIEVRFKNTRKGFYSNPSRIPLQEGDIVAVEAALGHDIGIVSLSGELVKEQMRVKKIDLERNPLKKVYRKAKPHDIEKWQQAIALEHDTMIRSRKIAADLKLNMKIGDVEYQGDKTKAIFYYIADDRVDFRTLIKVLAETFHIRIEMKQIGARQEAGRIGGIGPCGRKLCCSTFITNFISVSTSAARYQDISLNPQKLAGQCGKLKCCLNYEVDAYVDAQKDFPQANIPLNTGEGMLYHQKTDIFGRLMSYTPDKEGKGIFVQIPVGRVKEIIALNRKGIIPPQALENKEVVQEAIKYTDGVGEESLNRFDEKKQKKRHPKRKNNNRENSNPSPVRNEKEKGGENNSRSEERRPGRNGQRPDQRRPQRPPRPNKGPRPQNNGEKQS